MADSLYNERWGGSGFCGCFDKSNIWAVVSFLSCGFIGMGRIVTLAGRQKGLMFGMSSEGLIAQVVHFIAMLFYYDSVTQSSFIPFAPILILASAMYIQDTRTFKLNDDVLTICLKSTCCPCLFMAQQINFLEAEAKLENTDGEYTKIISAPAVDTSMNA